MSEGWEYAPLFNMKFHATERTTDLVRRRRWHRKMIAEEEGASCFFSLSQEVWGTVVLQRGLDRRYGALWCDREI